MAIKRKALQRETHAGLERTFRAFLWKYYGFAFFYDFIFAYPIYNVLFTSHGLSVFQVSLLLVWWNVAASFFEVPSGALADHWSRKKTLAAAPVVKGACYLTWYLARGSFWLYAVGFTLWGLGGALASGTQQALLYDSLRSIERESAYEKIRGRQRFFFRLACSLGGIAGGFIAQHNIDLAVLFSVVPLVLAFVLIVSIQEPRTHSSVADASYRLHFQNTWGEIKKNRTLRYVFVYLLLGIGIFADMDEYDPLYYVLVGVPVYVFGFLSVTRGLLESLGGLVAYRLKNYPSLEYWVPFVTGCLLITAGFFPHKGMIVALMLSYLLVAPIEVLLDGKMQHAIDSSSRATITSAASLFSMLCGLPLLLLFGLLSDHWGLGSGYAFFGALLVAFSCWVSSQQKVRDN